MSKSSKKICKYCKSEIDKNAKVCPVCNKKQKKPIFIFVLIAVVAIVAIIALSSGGPKEDPIVVSVDTLIDAYTANEVNADATYKDKIITVTGTVQSIGTDITNTVYFTFDKGGMFEVNAIQFYFTDSAEIAKVGNLHEGDTVTVTGTCKGFSIFNVLVKNCTIQ
jgi:hypothetical protein